MTYHQNQSVKVKVTHTLRKKTHEAIRALVAVGKVSDVSSFIEDAVNKALQEQERLHLQLELEAFENAEYRAEVATYGNTGLEDIQPFLGEKQ